MPRTRRSTVAGALVAVGALWMFTALAAVLAPGTPDVDPRAVAARVLAPAREAEAGGIAERVDQALPAGGRAVVVRPGRANEPSSRSGNTHVAVLVGEADRAALSLLVSNGGVVGSDATPDGWWASVAVPATVPAPVGPVLALLVGAVLLGAAAAEVPRRPATGRDVLVRGLVDLVPQLPGSLAWQTENLLVSAGVRPVVPDGRPYDPHRHHAVGTEPTTDEALVDTVARTVRPGYADGARIVVRPSVVVYVRD